MDDYIRIEALENGFEVECLDPKIAEANNNPKAPYKSPYKAYAFSTADEVTAFVKAQLGKIKPKGKSAVPEFDSAFKAATATED